MCISVQRYLISNGAESTFNLGPERPETIIIHCISIIEIFDYFKIEKNKVLNIKTTLKNYINNKIHLKFKEFWRNSLFDNNGKASCNNKLHTYRLFKDRFIQGNYLKQGSRWRVIRAKKTPCGCSLRFVLVPKEKWKSPCNFTKSLC